MFGNEPKERGLLSPLRQPGSLPPGKALVAAAPRPEPAVGRQRRHVPPARRLRAAAGSRDHGHPIQPGRGRKFPLQTMPALVPFGHPGRAALEPELLELGQLWGGTLSRLSIHTGKNRKARLHSRGGESIFTVVSWASDPVPHTKHLPRSLFGDFGGRGERESEAFSFCLRMFGLKHHLFPVLAGAQLYICCHNSLPLCCRCRRAPWHLG